MWIILHIRPFYIMNTVISSNFRSGFHYSHSEYVFLYNRQFGEIWIYEPYDAHYVRNIDFFLEYS